MKMRKKFDSRENKFANDECPNSVVSAFASGRSNNFQIIFSRCLYPAKGDESEKVEH